MGGRELGDLLADHGIAAVELVVLALVVGKRIVGGLVLDVADLDVQVRDRSHSPEVRPVQRLDVVVQAVCRVDAAPATEGHGAQHDGDDDAELGLDIEVDALHQMSLRTVSSRWSCSAEPLMT